MTPFSIMNKEIEPEVDEIDEIPEIGEDEEDTTDWKALALKNQGIAKRNKTKLDKLSVEFEKSKNVPPEKPATKEEKPNELDYGQKAFLKTYGIAGADELALVKNWVERTGDQIDTLVEDEIFTARLQGLRAAKAAKDALPTNPRRGQVVSSKDKADYWLDKPFEEVPANLKRDVLNLKLIKEKENDKFSGNKIVVQ